MWVEVGHKLWYYFNPHLWKKYMGDIMITDEELENWFTYHQPDAEQVRRYKEIRDAALVFATVVVDNTPANADQSDAIRSIRNAVMTANASIACG